MVVENPITNERFELSDEEARYFEEALRRFNQNENWISFLNFTWPHTIAILRRYKSSGKLGELKTNPLCNSIRDMHIQLSVNQGKLADDRKPGVKSFCPPPA